MSKIACVTWWVIIIALTAVLFGFAGYGFWSAFSAKQVAKPEVVTAKPMVRQADTSVIAAREPATADLPPAPHVIPKGAIEERRGHITVKQTPVSRSGNPSPESFAPVTVDYSLVREQDGGRRMVVSSPDGQVLDAVDIPIEPALVPPEPKRWSAGVAYRPGGGYGAVVTRDVERFRMGFLLLKPARSRPEAWVTASWSF